jgi:hypothetical protein
MPTGFIAGTGAADITDTLDEDRDITPETATRLRVICEKTGEEFDGNLTEMQARRRIAALEEVHDLS